MKTVVDTELDQKISELISFVKDFAVNKTGDYSLRGKHDGFKFKVTDNHVKLEFHL